MGRHVINLIRFTPPSCANNIITLRQCIYTPYFFVISVFSLCSHFDLERIQTRIPPPTSVVQQKMANVAISSCQNIALPLLLSTIHLASSRGFAKKPINESNQPSRKKEKADRNKLMPCSQCRGTGKTICVFCKGTKIMSGFLGQKVPCVPCEQKGTLDRPCKHCNGMRFTNL